MLSVGIKKKIRDPDVITPKQKNMTDETTFEESEREELAAQNTADLTGLQSRKCATWQECNNSYFIGKVETTTSEKWTSPIKIKFYKKISFESTKVKKKANHIGGYGLRLSRLLI